MDNNPNRNLDDVAPDCDDKNNVYRVEPELGAHLNREAPGDPRPLQPKDPGLEYVSCECPIYSSYNNCMESVSCPAASTKRAKVNAMQASYDRLNKYR